MLAVKRQRLKEQSLLEDEPPEKNIVSAGDILIKQLYKKQTNTATNLQEQLQQKKEFESATEFLPITSFTSGNISLQGFQSTIKCATKLEKLKAAGLSDEDICLYTDSERGEDVLFARHKNYEKSMLQKRIQEIKQKICNFENTRSCVTENDINKFGRHQLECALSIKPHSMETKLLKFAMENNKKDLTIMPHPMDNIKQIESECFEHLSREPLPPLNKIRKKARNLANKIKRIEEQPTATCSHLKTTSNDFVTKSKWDSKEICDEKPKVDVIKTYTCEPKTVYTVRDGQIVALNDASTKSFNQNNMNLSKQLTIEEIRKLPRFENYDPGSPSRVLYFKNLHKKVTSQDLLNLLQTFENSIADIKLLTGKMAGQAFLTFVDSTIATDVLNKLNGIIVKNKPIIIEFGKRKTDNG